MFSRGDGEVGQWIADLSRPGALTAALNWARANAAPRMPGPPPSLPPVQVPVLGIWPDGDHYLDGERMRQSAAWVAGPWRSKNGRERGSVPIRGAKDGDGNRRESSSDLSSVFCSCRRREVKCVSGINKALEGIDLFGSWAATTVSFWPHGPARYIITLLKSLPPERPPRRSLRNRA